MDWSKVHRKLAGRFRLLERRNEDGDCVIHCFGSLGQTGVNNDDVRYICGFYSSASVATEQPQARKGKNGMAMGWRSRESLRNRRTIGMAKTAATKKTRAIPEGP